MEKSTREALNRQRDIRRLAAAMASLRSEVERVRDGTSRLAALEARRSLTLDEAAEARQLRWASERLSLELANLRAEFEWVKARQP